ncbi:MAG: hypothetical protein ACRCXZ_00245 [Patescibacteria group bacterium]
MTDNLNEIASKQINKKPLNKKSIESEFQSILKEAEKKSKYNTELQIEILNSRIAKLRLSPKASSQKLASMVQDEINRILNSFENTEEAVIKLENFYQIEKKVTKLKLQKINLTNVLKVIKVYFIAFFTTIPDIDETDSTLIMGEKKEFQPEFRVGNHLLEINNYTYESYNTRKFRTQKISKIYLNIKERLGFNQFTLQINKKYKVK